MGKLHKFQERHRKRGFYVKGNWPMRENLDAIKRLVAFTLTVFLLGTTIWNDVFVIATEENHCSEYVDEQTYAANILQPVGEGDGYCDHCGQVEQAHIHTEESVEVQPEPEIIPEEQELDGSELAQVEEDTDIEPAEEIQQTDTPVIENGEEPAGDTAAEINDDDSQIEENEETPDEDIEDEVEKEEANEEKDKEKDEECEHEWKYTSNGDGTHVKKCAKCDEESIEDCTFDENGKCIHCGYQKEEEKEEELVYQEFSKTLYGVNVLVKGDMPSGATVDIFYIGKKTAEHIVNDNLEAGTFIAFAAYDITIYDSDGNKYQPEDNGNTVEVTFSGVGELAETPDEEIVVYRIEQDYSVTEIQADVVGEEISFEAEHFTTYTTGTVDNKNYMSLESYQTFAEIATASNAKKYTKVKKASFDLYASANEEYKFDVEVYRNLKSDTNPVDGDLIATGSGTVKQATTGWTTAQIDVSENNTGDGYIAAGYKYSIVVKHENSDIVKIGYGNTVNGDTKTFVKGAGSEWERDGNNDKTLYIINADSGNVAATIEEIDEPADSFQSISLSINDTRVQKASDGKYYLTKLGASENGITVTAQLDPSAERTIAWSLTDGTASGSTTSNSVLSVTASTPMTADIKTLASGETTLTASYRGVSTEITIVVLNITINGNDAIGDTSAVSVDYTGSAMTSTDIAVKLYKGTTQITSGVTVGLPTDKNAGKKEVTINYKIASTTLSFTRYFDIAQIDITKKAADGVTTAFTNAEFTVAEGVVKAVTNVNTNNVLTTTPTYENGDFTATVDDLNGIQYTIIVEGQGNFKGTLTVDYNSSDISKLLKVELSATSVLKNYSYKAEDVELTPVSNGGWRELTFKNNNGVTVSNVVLSGESGNATYKIYDFVEGYEASDYERNGKQESKKNAGKKAIVVTMNGGGYTGSIATDFTIQKADLANTTIVWTNSGSFPHDGKAVEPKPDTDFKVYFKGETTGTYGPEVSSSDYVVSYPGDHTDIGDGYYVKITGAGVNFASNTSQKKSYSIVANYKIDLVVRISENGNHDGNKKNSYATGYTRYYDGTNTAPAHDITTPRLSVRLDGELTYGDDYTYKIYDSYTKGATNPTVSPSVGRKYIVITPIGNYEYDENNQKNEEIVATYEVIPKPLTDSDIVNNITWGPKAKKKTFNGEPQTWTTAMSSTQMKSATGFSSNIADAWDEVTLNDPDLTIKFGTDYLIEGVDYVIDYGSNYVNNGQVRPKIIGKGNYEGSILSGSAYNYTIDPATVALTGNNKAVVSINGTPNLSYDGNRKCPDIKVVIGDPATFTEVYTYAEGNLSSENFDVQYGPNMSPGTGTITVTGKNNLTGSAIITFNIGTNTTEYKEIYLDGNQVNMTVDKISETPITENGKTIGYERVYKCQVPGAYYKGAGLPVTFPVNVIGKDGKSLNRNTDISYSFRNNDTVNESTTYTTAASPYVKITGLNDYRNNNAIVFFNIKRRVLTDDDVTITYDNDDVDNESYGWTGLDVDITNLVVTLKGDTTPLVLNTDYEIVYPTGMDKASAGAKTFQIKFIDKYDGVIEKPYKVGTDINKAAIKIYNKHDPAEEFSKNGELYVTEWRHDPPRVELKWGTSDYVTIDGIIEGSNAGGVTATRSNGTTDTQDTGLDISVSNSKGFTGADTFRSRAAGDDSTDKNYNIITLTITPTASSRYFNSSTNGTTVIKYVVQPVSLASTGTHRVQFTEQATQQYTGGDIPVAVSGYLICGSSDNAATNFPIVSGDYKPDPYLLDGENDVTDTNTPYTKAIMGVGNFTDNVVRNYTITKGLVNIDVFRTETDTTPVKSLVANTNTPEAELAYTFTETQDYYYNGEEHKPKFVLKPADTTQPELEEGVDWKFVYPNGTNFTDTGTKEIDIEIIGKNYVNKVIKITYEVRTNDIKDFKGEMGDLEYTATEYGITTIAELVNAKKLSLTLKTPAGDVLTRSTDGGITGDYMLVTDASELSKIKSALGETFTSILVPSTDVAPKFIPSYKSNYVFVKGIKPYSGYCKIPFSVVLDITSVSSGGLAKVTMPKTKYTLAEEAAKQVRPTIRYRLTPGGEYTGKITTSTDPTITTLDSTVYVGGELKDVYTVKRDKEGKPGPDSSLAIEGQYICKGKASSVKDTTGETICFLADLSGNTHGLTINPTVYDFTGEPIEPTIKGIMGTKGESPNGDYTLTYEYKKYDNLTTTSPKNPVEPGFYYVTVNATTDSDYYENNTGTQLSFYIKYNLSKATMKFVDPANRNNPKSSVEYTGNDISILNRAIVSINSSVIYDWGANGDKVDLVKLTPEAVNNIGTYEIIGTPKDEKLFTDDAVKGTFRVTEVGLESNATFSFVSPSSKYTYTGGEIRPKVKGEITTTNKVLTEGTDFRVVYHNNVNAGDNTASIGIIGLGSYSTYDEEFTPNPGKPTEGLKFSIDPLDIETPGNNSDNVKSISFEVEDATYSGYYYDPTDPTKGKVELKPAVRVVCEDSDGLRYTLLKGQDWVIGGYFNNTSAKEKTATTGAPYVTISQVATENNTNGKRNVVGTKNVNFTIKQLDIGGSAVKLEKNTAEYTGQDIDLSNILKLYTTFIDEEGKTHNIPLTQARLTTTSAEDDPYKQVADNLRDYTITVTKGNENYSDGKIKEMGTYTIVATGITDNSCKGSKEMTFTVTERSLSANFHYYYDIEQGDFIPKAWDKCYDTDKKTYTVKDSSQTGLMITIKDVETIKSTDNPDNRPQFTIRDQSIKVANAQDPDAVTNGKLLEEGTDYTVELKNNTEAGSAAWVKNGSIKKNASIASGSPYVVITGINNYKDSIEIPYNIGKNILNQGWRIKFTTPTQTLEPWTAETADNPYRLTFTYNGMTQRPSVTVRDKDGHSTISSVSDYTVTYMDDKDNEDATINAGYKYVVITGKGDYCGTIKQKYSILRKPVKAKAYTHNSYLTGTNATDAFTNEKPMVATTDGTGNTAEQLEFTLSGGKLTRFTEETAKKYLYDSGLLTAKDESTNKYEYQKYIGYYYLKYDGSTFEPTITVTDKTLTSNAVIDNDADLAEFVWTNKDVASEFDQNPTTNEWYLKTYSQVDIRFKVSGEENDSTASTGIENGIGNYYVAGDSVVFHIRYILLPFEFDKDLDITFINGNDGNQYKYKGTPWEPEVLVTDGAVELVKDRDYTLEYSANTYPGEASVKVTGINNYKGEATKTFTIWGDLKETVAYHKEGDNYIKGVQVQQYTGTYITYGDPEIYLFIDGIELTDENALKHTGTNAHYVASGYSPINPTDNYATGGKVTYTGLSPYWSGEKTITYDIAFDPNNVQIKNVKESYTFTGYDIIPDFKLSIPTATVTKTEFSKDGEPYIEFDENDISNFEEGYFKKPGEFNVRMAYKVGTTNSGVATVDYRIEPVSVGNKDNVNVIYTKNQRYTGRQVQPMLTAYIASTNLRTGKSQMYTLEKDKDFSVDYGQPGTNIENTGFMTIKGITDEVKGTKIGTYTIALSRVTNLGIIENTGTSLTVTWNREIYATGTEVMLQKRNADGQYVDCLSNPVKKLGKDNTCKFTDLTSSTKYRVKARAYVDGRQSPSAYTTIDVATDIAQSDIDVVSNSAQTATITWVNHGDATLYYIYRADNATDAGKIVAIIPASTEGFTNTGLSSGSTYYYYLEGYYLSNAKLTRISESEHRKVVIQ